MATQKHRGSSDRLRQRSEAHQPARDEGGAEVPEKGAPSKELIETETKRPPDEAEVAELKTAFEELRARSPRTEVVMEATKIESPHSDSIGHTLALMNVVGSRSFHFMHESLKSLEAGSRPRGKKVGETETSINASLALVQAIQPQDEVEAALAIQMSGVHSLASELLGLAKQTDRTDHIALYAGLAVKLYRTFAMQIEALAKLRGGTKQQVEVRHVYVNGNAVIGNVSRGGGNAAVEHQPHAPGLEAPTVSALPCPFEAVGAAVPVTSYARQEALPDARRK